LTKLAKLFFRLIVVLGRPVNGLRPYRIYDWLARKAYSSPTDFQWIKDKYGNEFYLSPYYYLDRQIIYAGSYEPDLHRYFMSVLKEGMVAIDIGANIGAMTLHMARLVGSTGRILAFEPLPMIRERLQNNVDRNDLNETITVYSQAISDEDKDLEFWYADTNTENQGMGSLHTKDDQIQTQSTIVHARRLDSLNSLNIERCDLIKIDIQGGETAFLNGAIDFLTEFKPILVMEVDDGLIRSGSNTKDFFWLIESIGYKIYTLDNVSLSSNNVSPDFRSSSIVCLG